ncbi:hypothetical protein H9657_14015 [Cellulomonas sp. Sa3CUA2]|uniref:Uncharacterized protein n=1 Tax=Cellulomonas avistercoris TaxID=2762242 RepID=A0ABR8QG35_9CELL|nr:hypothetical protein [Cellulomonas avistercoris]MBD7919385.1 hypothetical protein [Cellulomonas avistercoris]
MAMTVDEVLVVATADVAPERAAALTRAERLIATIAPAPAAPRRRRFWRR